MESYALLGFEHFVSRRELRIERENGTFFFFNSISTVSLVSGTISYKIVIISYVEEMLPESCKQMLISCYRSSDLSYIAYVYIAVSSDIASKVKRLECIKYI